MRVKTILPTRGGQEQSRRENHGTKSLQQERINSPMGDRGSRCKRPENTEQNKPNAGKKKEIIERRAEIDEIVNGTIQNIRETGHWCLAEVNEIDKCLASQTKEKGVTQTIDIGDETEDNMADPTTPDGKEGST